MSNLINITKTDEGKEVVSAKELYLKLGYNKAHWSKWWKKNIQNNEFAVEFLDYEGFALSVNGNKTKDFALTIDFAKKLCMLARTKKGEEIRDYFIEREKLSYSPKTKTLQLAESLVLAMSVIEESKKENLLLQQKNELQEQELKKQAPKVKFFDEVLDSNSLVTTTSAAMNIGMSAICMNRTLKQENVIRRVDKHWVLCADYLNYGLGKVCKYPYTNSIGEQATSSQFKWSEKGCMFLHIFFNEGKRKARAFMKESAALAA